MRSHSSAINLPLVWNKKMHFLLKNAVWMLESLLQKCWNCLPKSWDYNQWSCIPVHRQQTALFICMSVCVYESQINVIMHEGCGICFYMCLSVSWLSGEWKRKRGRNREVRAAGLIWTLAHCGEDRPAVYGAHALATEKWNILTSLSPLLSVKPGKSLIVPCGPAHGHELYALTSWPLSWTALCMCMSVCMYNNIGWIMYERCVRFPSNDNAVALSYHDIYKQTTCSGQKCRYYHQQNQAPTPCRRSEDISSVAVKWVCVIDVQLNPITAQFLPRSFSKTVSPTCRGPFEHLSCVTSLFEDGPVVILVNDSDH